MLLTSIIAVDFTTWKPYQDLTHLDEIRLICSNQSFNPLNIRTDVTCECKHILQLTHA